MKTYGMSGWIAPSFLTSALDGGEWPASLSGRFTPKEITPGTHLMRRFVGSRIQEKNLAPCRDLNPGRPARNPSPYWLSYLDSIASRRHPQGFSWYLKVGSFTELYVYMHFPGLVKLREGNGRHPSYRPICTSARISGGAKHPDGAPCSVLSEVVQLQA
jgi:hypothetical protein